GGAGGAVSTSSCTSARTAGSSAVSVIVKDAPELRMGAREMAAHGPGTDAEAIGDRLLVEVVPVREDDDGPLPQAQARDVREDVRSGQRLVDAVAGRGARFAPAATECRAVMHTGFVEYGAREVRAWVGDRAPHARREGAEDGVGDHVGSVGRSD